MMKLTKPILNTILVTGAFCAICLLGSCSGPSRGPKSEGQDTSTHASTQTTQQPASKAEAVQREKNGSNLMNAYARNQVNSNLVPFRAGKNPNDKEAEVLYNSGTAKAKGGDYTAAVTDFTRSLELSPYGYTYLRRGYSLLMLKEYDKAIDDLDQAIPMLPTPELGYLTRGMCHFEQEKFDEAEKDFLEYLKKEKSNPLVFNYLAGIRFMKQDFKGAQEYYSTVISLDPDFADVYTNRGMMRHYQNDLKGAIEDYNEAIRKNPANATAYNNRGGAKMNLKDYNGALADFSEAIAKRTEYADAYDNRGRVKLKLGDHDGACADWHKALLLGMTKSQEMIAKYCR